MLTGVKGVRVILFNAGGKRVSTVIGSIGVKDDMVRFSSVSNNIWFDVCKAGAHNYIYHLRNKLDKMVNYPYYRVYVEGMPTIGHRDNKFTKEKWNE